MSVSEQVHVGIRPVFIDTFLGSGVSVSEQLGIRPVFIDIFLGRAMSVSEQVAGIKLGGNLGEISRHGGRNFALNWAQGEVGVSLKKKKKNILEFSSNHSTNKL